MNTVGNKKMTLPRSRPAQEAATYIRESAMLADTKLQCTYSAIIIRNESLKGKFPGGVSAFVNRYRARCNDKITVHCSSGVEIWRILNTIKSLGMRCIKDFVTIDTSECQMWRLIHQEKVNRPFWFRTGATWLKCEHWDGDIWVWYHE